MSLGNVTADEGLGVSGFGRAEPETGRDEEMMLTCSVLEASYALARCLLESSAWIYHENLQNV